MNILLISVSQPQTLVLHDMNNNIEIVLELLKNEVDGDVSSALSKMTKDYSMTWMYKSKQEMFPTSKKEFESEMKEEVYPIKGRKYEIKHVAEGENVIMVELIESYPDPETKKMYQTPLVLVLEMHDGKVQTGRHYCDPQISYENLSKEALERAYRHTPNQRVIE